MCGISGILEFDINKIVESYLLKGINSKLIHRGPDFQDVYCDKNVGLGNCRLSIIDLATGNQPIHNENKKIWVVLNGEIYNFKGLRSELLDKGHVFYTNSDTETIVHLYEEEGEKFISRLDGMFALALWDSVKQKLLLARDPLGKKPLYWTIQDKKIVFASELKSLLAHPNISSNIDKSSLLKYFVYGFIPAPATIFENINKIEAGHYLSIGLDGIPKDDKYWDIDYSNKLSGASLADINKTVLHSLKSSVEKRLISDVPLGAFLSGGVDSSLVVYLMTQIIPADKVHAFTIGFKNRKFDETDYAKDVAKKLKINHHIQYFEDKDLSLAITKIFDFVDEPISDPSLVPTFLLSEFTRKSVKVALSGDGGDESFAGYPKYVAHYIVDKCFLNKLPLGFFSEVFKGRDAALFKYLNLPLPLRNQLWISAFSPDEAMILLNHKTGVDIFSDIEKYHRSFNGRDVFDEPLFLDQKLTLADLYLVKVDRASMANSLEVRSPMLDKDFVSLAAEIPFKLKVKGFNTKYLLKKIAADFLPSRVVYRKKKGFGIPLGELMDSILKPEVKKVFNCVAESGLLNKEALGKVFFNGTPQQVWSIFALGLWYLKWGDSKSGAIGDIIGKKTCAVFSE